MKMLITRGFNGPRLGQSLLRGPRRSALDGRSKFQRPASGPISSEAWEKAADEQFEACFNGPRLGQSLLS